MKIWKLFFLNSKKKAIFYWKRKTKLKNISSFKKNNLKSKGPPTQCISRQICALVGRFILGFWLNILTDFFLLFFLSCFKMGLVLPKQVLGIFIMFSTKKQRWTLLQIQTRDALGRWPFSKTTLISPHWLSLA